MLSINTDNDGTLLDSHFWAQKWCFKAVFDLLLLVNLINMWKLLWPVPKIRPKIHATY